MSTTTKERKAEKKSEDRKDEDRKDDGGEKKRRPWIKWVLGAVLLVVIAIVAFAVLGGSSKKKAPPSGSLKAGKQQLLPLSPSGKLPGKPGQKVIAKSEKVLTIVRGKGFWVGGSKVDRVFVRYPPAGRNVSPQVSIQGELKPAPTNVKKSLGLSTVDTAKVTAEGLYIEASKVGPAQKP